MKTQGFSSTNPKIERRDDEVDEVDGYFLFDDIFALWGMLETLRVKTKLDIL